MICTKIFIHCVRSKKVKVQHCRKKFKDELHQNEISLEKIKNFTKHKNFIYRILLDRLPNNLDSLRGKYGFFYEFETNDINEIAKVINKSFQTLTYFGFKKSFILNFVERNRLLGIDNVVPIGNALDIGVFWDGYDVIRSLSRTINIQ